MIKELRIKNKDMEKNKILLCRIGIGTISIRWIDESASKMDEIHILKFIFHYFLKFICKCLCLHNYSDLYSKRYKNILEKYS